MVITNGPQDTTVCVNQFAYIPCGFTGADPNLVVPSWTIQMRNRNGMTETFHTPSTPHNKLEGLEWIPDSLNGSNSALRVGPMEKADNQSSYQCFFQIGNVHSSVGILTVLSKLLMWSLYQPQEAVLTI